MMGELLLKLEIWQNVQKHDFCLSYLVLHFTLLTALSASLQSIENGKLGAVLFC